jgi:hypothetical protein
MTRTFLLGIDMEQTVTKAVLFDVFDLPAAIAGP